MMPDREKVISELNEYIESALAICAPDVDYIPVNLLKYTVALLKEQEAPSKEELISHYGKMYKCKRCGLEWYQQTQKYCQECGTAVKWNV